MGMGMGIINKIKTTKILKDIRKGMVVRAINKVSKEEYIILDVVRGCFMLSDEENLSIKVETIEDLLNKYNLY